MTVRTERLGPVLHVQLDRPERRNAVSRAMMAELRAALGADRLTGVVGVVVSGAGSAFSAGADLAEVTGTETDATFDDEWAAVVAAVRAVPRPVVAAIDGPCRGAAVDLALACDVRVAGDGATFGVPAVRLGLLYRPEAVARMHREVGGTALRRLLLLGDAVDARGALSLGLVHEVVPSGTAVAHAVALLEQLPAESGEALAATKGLLTALDDGRDTTGWHQAYLEILRSPGRRALLGAAQSRHGGADQRSPAGTTPADSTSEEQQ